MPIYEYRCSSCGHELEKLQRMSDEALTDCPACEKPALQRLISAAGFRLKGSGWYETDFKKDNKRNVVETSGDKSEKSETADKTSKKDGESKTSETKPKDGGKKEAKSAQKSEKKADSTKATAA